MIGFLSGWVSVTVGLAAPIAAAAMALGKYISSEFTVVFYRYSEQIGVIYEI